MTSDDFLIPTASHARITDVLPACLACLDPDASGANSAARDRFGLEPADQVIVILADGLGLELLEQRYALAPVLRAARSTTTEALTVVPSTTAAAITSFATGALPAQTGMVGYSVFTPTGVMNLLAFGPGYIPEMWQPVPTLFERAAQAGITSAVVSPPTFARSGLTRAALRGTTHVGAASWEDRIWAALNQVKRGTALTYLYWSDIDHVGHHAGWHSDQWAEALEDFDQGLRLLVKNLPAGHDARVVLTADHGMVDVKHEDLIDVADHPELSEGVRAIAGETRGVHIHAEPGQAASVLERWQEVLGERAWVVPTYLLGGLMGEGPLLTRVGDGLALMRGGFGVVDSRTQSPGSMSLVGVHGSLSSAEMRIPVVRLA